MDGLDLKTNALDLGTMTVDDLLTLRERISETLSSRVEAERRDLELRLARLRRVDLGEPRRLAQGGRVIGARAQVAPKYRNPDKPSETWSGRGRQPRWLTAALKAGKKLRRLRDRRGRDEEEGCAQPTQIEVRASPLVGRPLGRRVCAQEASSSRRPVG